jgi:hypothetical protein
MKQSGKEPHVITEVSPSPGSAQAPRAFFLARARNPNRLDCLGLTSIIRQPTKAMRKKK